MVNKINQELKDLCRISKSNNSLLDSFLKSVDDKFNLISCKCVHVQDSNNRILLYYLLQVCPDNTIHFYFVPSYRLADDFVAIIDYEINISVYSSLSCSCFDC